jgi:hypothetical protein
MRGSAINGPGKMNLSNVIAWFSRKRVRRSAAVEFRESNFFELELGEPDRSELDRLLLKAWQSHRRREAEEAFERYRKWPPK